MIVSWRTYIRNFAVSVAFIFLYFCAPHVDAAFLYFDPTDVSLARGDSVTVGLRIDTDENECINTVDAVVYYDPTIKAVDISRGDSILNVWLEDPVINETEHSITFAGGIPGGYCGRVPGDPSLTNVLLELVFRSPGFTIGAEENSSARIWVSDSSQVLLHDGLGTNATLRLQDAHISLLDTAGNTPTDTWRDEVQADNDLPSDFAITLTKDDNAFSGKYFIVFNAVDKQSGIDHYEVMEEPFKEFDTFAWGRADAPWIITESPYVLTDQTLNSTIRVKAFDKAGNERIEVLVPDTALRSMSRDALVTAIVIGGAVLLLGALIFFAIWKRKQRILKDIENHE